MMMMFLLLWVAVSTTLHNQREWVPVPAGAGVWAWLTGVSIPCGSRFSFFFSTRTTHVRTYYVVLFYCTLLLFAFFIVVRYFVLSTQGRFILLKAAAAATLYDQHG